MSFKMLGIAMVRIRARHLFVLDAVVSSLFLITVSPLLALDPGRQISQYGHTAWRVQDGAIPPSTQIAQTTDGYIWFGTSQGLMRFDGVRFTRWQPPQGQTLPGTHFTALLGSRDGGLWIGTTRGLARWKDGQLRTYTDSLHPAGISAITEDDSGIIWATRYSVNARESPLCSISEDTLRCFGKKDGIPVTYGLGLTHDREGNIWFGSKVLIRWRPGTPATTYFGEIPDKIAKGDGVIDVALGPSDTAWASIDATGPQLGVRYYSGGRWTSYVVPGFDGARVRSHALLVDRRGSLWVGTQNDGVYRICRGVADHYTVSDGLSGNTVGLFLEDREGNIWVLTDGGVDMFRDTALISYTTRQGLSDSSFRSVLALRDGAVWVGTDVAINILREQERTTTISQRKLSGESGRTMVEDQNGVVWLGTDFTLMRFQNVRFRETQAPGGQPFRSFGGVSGIAEGSDGTIWVLTRGGQLFSIVGDKIKKRASLNDEFLRKRFLAGDQNGGVWLGAENGTISYFRDGRLQPTSLSSPNGPVAIRALLVDSDSSLLVSSSQGLYRLNQGQVTHFGGESGLPCPDTFSAIRDNHGSLWIYTRCGLVRVAQSEWARWIENPHVAVSVVILDAVDGARAGTGDPYQPTSSKSPDGRLWFVAGASAQVIDPDSLNDRGPQAPVYVEAVVVDHKLLPTRSSIQIPALTRDVEIDYTALSFSAPQKVQFRYMLEGHDREWQDAGTRRQAFYTDLAPRHYRFRVIASNSHGVWNQTGASLEFVVLPAYYQTNLFRLSCVALFIALLWALHRWRVHQLKSQERKLRDVVETIPAMTFTALSNGSCTFANKRWTEYTGLSVKETSGAGWQRAIHPEDLASHSEKWRTSVATGQPFEDEARFSRAPNGDYRWFLVRAVPLCDEHGHIVKWYGTVTDIEDRKQAEQALRESERRFRLIFDGIGGLIAIMTSEGQLELVNSQILKYFDKTVEDLKGWTTGNEIHPDDLPNVLDAWRHSVETGDPYDVDHRLRRFDGAYRWFHARGLSLSDAESRIVRWYVLLTDIDDRKKAEEHVRRSEALLAESQRLSLTASWAYDPATGSAVYWSEEMFRMLQFDPKQGLPTAEAFFQRVHPADRESVIEVFTKATLERTEYDDHHRLLLPDGAVKYLHGIGHPVFDESGKVIEYVGTEVDETERKQAEQERERLRQLEADLAHINRVSMMGELAASLAHEIKQPLAAAITSANSCIEWLAHEPPNLDRARTAAARIDKYGNRAAEIIDRIRSFYRKSPPQRELVDVKGIVDEIFTLLQSEANRCSVVVRTELAVEVPKIMADRVQLQQVFMNLMLNAIEAMGELGGELTVKSQLQDGQLQCSVSDTGVGLPPEEMEQIFSAFFTTKPKGSGMGLAISRSIVESHGGRLWATPNDSQGAAFHFTLPIQLTESSPLVM